MSTRHSYAQAAALLGVEESWLRRHIKQLPHTKLGRVVYFTGADLERIDQLFHHEPATGPLANATAPATAPAPHPMSHLRPLPSRRSAALTG
ncbi:helix-turn-helix domain-containing protein [Streptomyces longwoodensis]|uniref:helix-turn-helix domain-containing protein n=1 Tax=Streptomyces longwoodensis TaxID=68231 RepID=UPI002DDA1A3B|nr:helix-turn-helix domain-containing protein [Streptomyces longwoodensis]WRY88776.1 helix-turn-helix domain-containing protein [Streptomyces longwoodensis]